MSRLAQEWAEKSFKLPRRIAPKVEQSMANGYMFLVMCKQCGSINEEDFEGANDGTTPDVIMQNMVLLARALKAMDIKMGKAEVAALISEEPGQAADIIMNIKSAKEAGGKKQRPKTPPYKQVIHTVRPQEDKFERPNFFNDERDAYQRFMEDMLPGKDLTDFSQVHYTAQEAKYHTFKFNEDIKIWDADRAEEERGRQERDDRIDRELARKGEMNDANRTRDAEGLKKWKESRRTGHNRKIRDTQFEMAVLTAKQYRKVREDHVHSEEEQKGIDAFEVNLKRAGIGGDDEGGKLSVTYEDPQSFLYRMIDTAGATAPTNEECGDFLAGLKERTVESRTARYEKARSQRRMLVEQASAAPSSAADDTSDGPGEVEAMAQSIRYVLPSFHVLMSSCPP